MELATETVRTTIEIPGPVYEKLIKQAAQRGCSVEELLTQGLRRVLAEPEPVKERRVSFPIIRSKGPKVSLTNKQLYELVEFP